MEFDRCLFWHRRDLRINDNIGLSSAINKSIATTGVFIIDPSLFNYRKGNLSMSPARSWFLLNSLIELYNNWKSEGSELIILKGNPKDLIPTLARIINAKWVVWNKNFEPNEIIRDEDIIYKLKKLNIEVDTYLDQLIVDPNRIKTLEGNPYKVYSPFYRKWSDCLLENKIVYYNIKRERLIGLREKEYQRLKEEPYKNEIENPLELVNKMLNNNGFDGQKACPCIPGESAAKKSLEYFTGQNIISQYNKERDYPSAPLTSFLSAALNNGTISCRNVLSAAEKSKYKNEKTNSQDSIECWIREIAWREFYQNIIINFPELEKGPYRKKWKSFPWVNNKDWFNSWKDGLTGIPIIDASMRQLKETGWMHNRCRMIIASFVVKDLICNWQWGEIFFMENLVDGDLAANNGGWQWGASSGMDTKPLRIFNPSRQARKFDPEAKYIRRWLPELSHISSNDLISGEINALERKCYPPPILNHNIQQAIFKDLYSTLKN